MLAVQLDAPGGAVTVRPGPVPTPGPGEVLIRIAASPVNPSDLAFLMGSSVPKPYPAVPGNEGSGTVVAAGAGLLPRLFLGKRVACAPRLTAHGAWAEYMVTTAVRCIPLRRHVSLEQGAMLLVNPLTAVAFFDIVRRERHPALVSTAAASALGRMIVRLGQKYRVPVINIVRRHEQADLLYSIGATYVLNSTEGDFLVQLRMLIQQLRATLILDALAGRHTQELLSAALPGSTVLVYGFLAGEQDLFDARALLYQGNRLVGFYLPNWLQRRGFLQALRDAARVQRLVGTDFHSPVQKRLPLVAVREALDLYQSNMTAGKVLLVGNPDDVPVD